MTSDTRVAPSAARAASVPARRRRADIQGLRAIASLLVASYHVWFGTVSGGVDVFFAIGGFLLVHSLAGELERSGRIDVWGGIRRQARRLFPMAAIVLVVIGGLLLALGTPLSAQRTIVDVFASATYWENWRLAADATDYVAAGHDKSAFQHFWAMSAQGQVTLTLIVVFALLGVAAATIRRWSVVRIAAVTLAAATVASFAYAQWRVVVDPAHAYFDTWARLWELSLGGVVALTLARLPLGRIVRAVMGGVGVAMVLTAGLLPTEWPQPGLVTLYPVAGALLILVAGSGEPLPGPAGSLLRWRPLVWIGGISYGVYLWHWPLLKVYQLLFPQRGEVINAVEGALIIGGAMLLSWLSFRLIAAVAAARDGFARVGRLALEVSLPVVAVVALVGTLVAPAMRERALAEATAGAVIAPSEQQLSRWLDHAASEHQAMGEGMALNVDGRQSEWVDDGCATVDRSEVAQCTYPAASPSSLDVWIVGDSHAVTWAPAVRTALGDVANVTLLGRENCQFTDAPIVDRHVEAEHRDPCRAHIPWVLELAEQERPELVLISYGGWWVGPEFGDEPDVGTQLAAGGEEHVRALQRSGAQVAWLDAPPWWYGTGDSACFEESRDHLSGELCAMPLSQERVDRHDQLGAAYAAMGAHSIDTLRWFCDVEARSCPLIVEGVPVFADQRHMGSAYSLLLSSLVAGELRPLVGV